MRSSEGSRSASQVAANPMPSPAQRACQSTRWSSLLKTKESRSILMPERGETTNYRVVPIQANEIVAHKVAWLPGYASTAQVVLPCICPDLYLPNASRNQRRLRRAHHPNRDVRLPPQQVTHGIGRNDVDGDTCLTLPKPGEKRRQ